MANGKRDIVLVAHNLRSCHNVGSLFRTAEGLGIKKIYLTGYTPYPVAKSDDRLPYIAIKMQKQIDKTALGAVHSMSWEHSADIYTVIDKLKKQSYVVVALEQTSSAADITTWTLPPKIALVVGHETDGIELSVQRACDGAVEIPMLGKKESYNVAQAAAMALYHCRFCKQ